jgi:hypothetical protein
VQAQGFRSREAVRARRGARQTFFEEVRHWLRPSGGVVTTRDSRDPQTLFFSRAGTEVRSGESIEVAPGKTELVRGFGGREGVLSEGSQDMADERRCVAMGELLVLFKRIGSTGRIPPPSPFVGLRYAPASSRARRGDASSAPLVEPKCPGLLTTESVLVCSPHDSREMAPVGPGRVGGW